VSDTEYQPKPPYSFHTESPVVLQWYDDWRAHTEHHEKVLAEVAAEIAPFEGAQPAVTGAWGHYTFEGFHHTRYPIPDGWRVVGRNSQWITPKRSTKAGKAIVKRMAEVPPFWELRRFGGGIPGMKLDVHFGRLPAMQFGDGEVWAHFGDDWDQLDIIDQTIWEVRRLSEFYAAAEARSDAEVTSPEAAS
jgi:hypothetical protein